MCRICVTFYLSNAEPYAVGGTLGSKGTLHTLNMAPLPTIVCGNWTVQIRDKSGGAHCANCATLFKVAQQQPTRWEILAQHFYP